MHSFVIKPLGRLVISLFLTVLLAHSATSMQDAWFDIFYYSDIPEHPCPNGVGEYPNPLFENRWYICEREHGHVIYKQERSCPLGTCYNRNHPSKCDPTSCPPSGTKQFPYPDYAHKCDPGRRDEPQSHPKDPTRYYYCQEGEGVPKGQFSYAREFRCGYGKCFTGNSQSPCGPTHHCPTMDASTSPSKNSTGEMRCLKRQTELAEEELLCKDETLAILEKDTDAFVAAIAHRGDQYQNFLYALRDIHLDMRQHYDRLIYSVGRNIFPLILATECDNPELCGVGGTYKLYLRDGSMKRISRVAPEFEAYKSLSHMALSVFTIVAPYFRTPVSTGWIPHLTSHLTKVRAASFTLRHSSKLPAHELSLASKMLQMVDDYITDSITNQYVDEDGYHKFATTLAPLINSCMEAASRLQAEHILPELSRWKAELGDEWRKTHVIITTVWPVSRINVRLQMFEQLMSFEQVEEQVVIVEGTKNEEEAINTLGRIVASKALGMLVFGGLEDEDMKDHAFSISTRRDLLSTQAGRAIEAHCEKSASSCPMKKIFGRRRK